MHGLTLDELAQLDQPYIHALVILRQLGEKGYVVSVCYGSSGEDGELTWSCHYMAPDGYAPENPFIARSFLHAVEILKTEISKREKMFGHSD